MAAGAATARTRMYAPQFGWSPTAEDFTRHQLLHVTNFWRQGRAAEYQLKTLPSGQAELCLTFELPPPSDCVPPPINPALPPRKSHFSQGSNPINPCPNLPLLLKFFQSSARATVAQCYTRQAWPHLPFPLPSMVRFDRLLRPVFSACRLIKPRVKRNDRFQTPHHPVSFGSKDP